MFRGRTDQSVLSVTCGILFKFIVDLYERTNTVTTSMIKSHVSQCDHTGEILETDLKQEEAVWRAVSRKIFIQMESRLTQFK